MKKLWEEFIVRVKRDDGLEITLCGLCGNSGQLDTTKSAQWSGRFVGVASYCICPNGRAIKKQADKITKSKNV